MSAYLVLVTWADGREGLLFPRPGNVKIADTPLEGLADFVTAKQDLIHFAERLGCEMQPTTVRLVKFERMETLEEFTL